MKPGLLLYTLVLLVSFMLLPAGCGSSDSNENDDQSCLDYSCGEHGRCVVSTDGPACVCDAGYTGDDCDSCAAGYERSGGDCLKSDPCAEDPCRHGVCMVVNGEASCSCHAGYAGALCDRCDLGYVAVGLECLPESICSSESCVHGACMYEDGEAVCACDTGYTGDHCDECAAGYVQDGDRCVPGEEDDICDPNPCNENNRTICVEDEEELYRCECDPGYMLQDDQCVLQGGPCTPNPCEEEHRTRCVTDGENYTCECDNGYYDDGGTCVQSSGPCQPNPCTEAYRSVCQESGEDAYVCLCDPGYTEEQGVCVENSACSPNPCTIVHQTVCVEITEGYRCDCDTGYHEENGGCVLDSVCSPNPCDEANRSRCLEQGDSYECLCDPGYHLESESCVLDETCDAATTCSGHGQCAGSGLDCICDEEYAGSHCEDCAEGYHETATFDCVADTPCDPNPCTTVNKTECVAQGDSFTCECDEGYQDENDDGSCLPDCSTASINCGDFGHCEIVAGQANCVCNEGYLGPLCDMRSCGTVVEYDPGSQTINHLFIRGEFNGWGEGDELEKEEDGIYRITLTLTPGDYAYKLFNQDSNTWFEDPGNPFTKYVNGQRNSRLRVSDCDEPQLVLLESPEVSGNDISFDVAIIRGNAGSAIDSDLLVATRNGQTLASMYDAENRRFTIRDTNLSPNKYAYQFRVTDESGKSSNKLFVPVWVEEQQFDWKDGVMYFVMTDRFNDGDSSNNALAPNVDFRANWQGGDFAGVSDKIQSGYFDDLGVNVIWISSISMNTQGSGMGVSDGKNYSGYHSYWPVSTGWTEEEPLSGVEAVDPHFGDLQEFKDLVEEAHLHGIRVIVDFVANHFHESHPLYQQHKNDGWFHTPQYVCGWDRPIECWFTGYLPDLEYKNLDVLDRMTDHAVWLVQETNIDGFRLDAVKHMIHDFGWTLRARIDEEVDTTEDIRFYMVGETFVGADEASTILAYIGEDELDGQFDFPIYWRVLWTFLKESSDFNSLNGFMNINDSYYPDYAVMSNFMGNHDVARAISEANFENVGDPWGYQPGVPSNVDVFKKMRLAWSYLLTIPGIPLIYYGDEIGLPGASDPDNRRMMIFGNELSTDQNNTLQHVRALGQIRRNHPALSRGTRTTLSIDADFWVYALVEGSDKVVVVLNRNGSAQSRSVNLSSIGITSGTLTDELNGGSVSVSGGSITVNAPAKSALIFAQ